MKVLLLNGSPHKQGCTYTALCEVAILQGKFLFKLFAPRTVSHLVAP